VFCWFTIEFDVLSNYSLMYVVGKKTSNFTSDILVPDNNACSAHSKPYDGPYFSSRVLQPLQEQIVFKMNVTVGKDSANERRSKLFSRSRSSESLYSMVAVKARKPIRQKSADLSPTSVTSGLLETLGLSPSSDRSRPPTSSRSGKSRPARKGQQKTSKVDSKKATESRIPAEVPEDDTFFLLKKIEALEKSLRKIERRTKKELDEIKKDTKKSKKEFREQAEREHQAKLEGHESETEKSLSANEKIIEQLRHDNFKIREQNIEMLKNIRNLRINNRKLEQVQKEREAKFEHLQRHVSKAKVHNTQLEKQKKEAKKEVERFQAKVDEVTSSARYEYKCRTSYEKYFHRIEDVVTDMPTTVNKKYTQYVSSLIKSSLKEYSDQKTDTEALMVREKGGSKKSKSKTSGPKQKRVAPIAA